MQKSNWNRSFDVLWKLLEIFPFSQQPMQRKSVNLALKKYRKRTIGYLLMTCSNKLWINISWILSWCSMFMQSSIDYALFFFLAFEVNLCVAMQIDKRERIMLTALQQDAIVFGCHAQILVCVFVWVRRIGMRKFWTWQFHLKFKFENCQYISIKADMAVDVL